MYKMDESSESMRYALTKKTSKNVRVKSRKWARFIRKLGLLLCDLVSSEKA